MTFVFETLVCAWAHPVNPCICLCHRPNSQVSYLRKPKRPIRTLKIETKYVPDPWAYVNKLRLLSARKNFVEFSFGESSKTALLLH